MKRDKYYKRKLYIILLLLILFSTNCSKSKEEVKYKKKDKAPDSISSVSDNIQDILKNTEKIEMLLDGTYIEKENKKRPDEKEKEKEDTNNSKMEENKSQGEKDTQNSEDKSLEDNTEDVDKPKKDKEEKKENEDEKNKESKENWEKIQKKIEDIHQKWNDYENEGIKKGMTGEMADDFRNSLSELTKSIEDKNIEDIYNFAAECFLNLNPIFNLYQDEIKGEINKIKYAVYKSYLMGMNNKVNNGEVILEEGEKNINLIRIKIKEDDKEKLKTLEKLNLSIMDMKKSLSKKSIRLNRIKKDVIMLNLEALNN